jgi:AcrR family transcriptional regulator
MSSRSPRSAAPLQKRAAPSAASGEGDARLSAAGTADRLLDAAEALFVERGYSNVPVRDIVAVAGVNLGAIPYHFGTKQNLFKAVLSRRVAPIQAARRQRMTELLESGRPLRIEDILRAQLEPAFRASSANAAFRRLTGYAVIDPHPEVKQIVSEVLDAQEPMLPRLLRLACPQLSEREFFWRLYCVYGALVYIQADTGRMQRIVRSAVDTSDLMPALDYVVAFLASGFASAALDAAPASASTPMPAPAPVPAAARSRGGQRRR